LIEIVHHLKQLNINANILTHGLDLDYEKILQIKESGVSCLGISLDGLEQNHDYVRGCAGAFKRVINSIKMTINENMPLHVITTVNSLNVHELPNILHLLQSLGVQSWRVQPLMPIGKVKQSKDLLVQKQAILELGQFIRRWKPIVAKEGMELVCSDGIQ
jgi:MoaA/NifB/PqqE/SkfB family radical SAM enzyme